LVLVYTGSDKIGRLYVDASLALTTPATDGTTATSTAPLTLGRNNVGNVDYYAGRIDEVAIYPRALSAARISAHYASGSGSGKLLRIHEPAGNQITLGYLGSQLALVSDSVGRQITLTYGTD